MADYALLVGIDNYNPDSHDVLSTPIRDIAALKKVLERDGSGRPLWVPKVLEGAKHSKRRVTDAALWAAIDDTLRKAARSRGQVLFYFAGHGEQSQDGEHHLVMQGESAADPDTTVPLRDIVRRLHGEASLKSATVIVDCCYSGGGVDDPDFVLDKDRAILTSSRDDEMSSDGHRANSPFAAYLVEGLEGVAATLSGEITLTSLYEYVAKRFGRDDQRPQLKINLAEEPILLRRVPPLIEPADLHELFPGSAEDVVWMTKDHEGPLGSRPYKPGYQPTVEQLVFDRLKALQIRGLLDTGGIQDLYWVAMQEPDGGPVKLSPLGRWYWHQWRLGWI